MITLPFIITYIMTFTEPLCVFKQIQITVCFHSFQLEELCSVVLFFNRFIDYAITVVPFPPHFTPSCPPPPSHIPPPQFMPMGHTYKFFGFYISSTIVTLPLSIFHLSFMLLILCTFPLLSPSHSPTDNPPCDLHFCGFVPVLVVCLVCFCFGFRCRC